MHYNDYSTYLKEKYGAKVYKLPVTLPQGTCPNRDGTVGVGGCTFCDASGAGFHCLPVEWSIAEQLKENKAFYQKRFDATKFISYLQTYTNTYRPFSDFCRSVEEAVDDPDIVGIAISTRPDCINEEYLSFLQDLQKRRNIDVDVELGLQTVNYHNLVSINRGHTLAEFIDAVLRIHAHELTTTAHVILNLPNDDDLDVIETAKVLSALGVDGVKIHSLYIVGGTELARQYVRGEFEIISMEHYIERVADFLEYLSPNMVIQRLVGKGPQKDLIFGNWDSSWWRIKDAIEDTLIQRGTYQGYRCDYLNGHALRNKERIEK